MEITIAQSIILGVVQGLTELLPVSSSAHLNLIPTIFNWSVPESFDVALHFGTLLAIVLFFFKDWVKLIKSGYNQVVNKQKSFEGKMFWYLVIATIPGGVIGFALDYLSEHNEAVNNFLNAPIVIAIALIIMGIILYIVDKTCSSKTKYEKMTFKQTFLIGLSQALAFIPGVSRSGITMTTGRALGVSRKSVAKYSFLLSTPIVAGATVFKLGDFIEFLSTASVTGIIAFVLGVFVSFIVGVIVIKFLLEYLKKGSFKIFAIYRCVLGIAIIIWAVINGVYI